jgi:hypothetical protein
LSDRRFGARSWLAGGDAGGWDQAETNHAQSSRTNAGATQGSRPQYRRRRQAGPAMAISGPGDRVFFAPVRDRALRGRPEMDEFMVNAMLDAPNNMVRGMTMPWRIARRDVVIRHWVTRIVGHNRSNTRLKIRCRTPATRTIYNNL